MTFLGKKKGAYFLKNSLIGRTIPTAHIMTINMLPGVNSVFMIEL